MRADRHNMGRVALHQPQERVKELRRERDATESAAAAAVLDFEIGWLYEDLGQIREAAESYLRGFTALSTFRPNLSALIRLAEQTGANPKGLYEAAIKQSQTEELRNSARVDLAYLALATDTLDHNLLRLLVLASQEQDNRDEPSADLALALELSALRLGEEAMARQGRDQQIGCDDLLSLRPFLIEERLWEVLRDQTTDQARFEETVRDVRLALDSLDASNRGRKAPILELAAQIARQAGRFELEASWLDELAAFTSRLGSTPEDDLDSYARIAQQQADSGDPLSAALYFEAAEARRRSGAHDDALVSYREAHRKSADSPELDRLIISEALMLAAERAGELEEAGRVARDLLTLEVPAARQQILWLRLSALEQARGQLEAAILATAHALETQSSSIAARASLLRLLAEANRHEDQIEALEGWARQLDGESRSLLLWQAAHLAARHAKSGKDATVASLYDAAIAASEHPAEILRAYADWSSDRHDHVEALLRVSQDPVERSVLKRQRWVEDTNRLQTDAETVLAELLEDTDCRGWAPAVVRYHAAEQQRFELLARAHQISANDGPTDVQVAHLLAAARAYIRAGQTQSAEPLLRQVLRLDERNPYGIALLAAVHKSEGQDEERVSLLTRVAAKEDERWTAQRKTHAAAGEAERHGLFESAARAYQMFLQRHEHTPAIAWCLLRLADRTKNAVWQEQALEHLASYERQQGSPGFGTLRWIEHLVLLRRRTTAQQGALQSALAFAASQPSIAKLASVWRAVASPTRDDSERGTDALRKELEDLAELESDWRKVELTSGALRLRLLSGDEQDEAFLRAKAQFEETPSAQTALSNLETVPWTDPASLGMRWEETAEHWLSGLSTLHEQAPNFVDAALMARWHLHNDNKPAALEQAQRAVSEDPDDLSSWMVLRNASLALQHWETFVQANEIVAESLEPARGAELKTLSGFACAFGLGDSARASSYFLEALELDALNDEAFGWVQQNLRGRQRAHLIAPLSVRIANTDDPQELLDLHLDLAMAYQTSGNFREAAVVLERALLLDETNEHLLAGVAETWIHLEEWERAQAALRSLASATAQTDTHDACILSAADILASRLRQSERAVELLAAAYPTMAARLPALDLLSAALEKLGEYHRAAGYAQEAISLTTRGERQPWLLRLGNLQRQAGDVDAARESYREALDSEPGDINAFQALLACNIQNEERRIRARQLLSALREQVAEDDLASLQPTAQAIRMAAQWTQNRLLAHHAEQVILALEGNGSSDGPLPHSSRRQTAQQPFSTVMQRFRLRSEDALDRAAERLQGLLLSILEHALEAYGMVTILDAGNPVALALSQAGALFGLDKAPVFRSTQGDDALGLVLGSDRQPAWVVGPNFEIEGSGLSPSKSFIVGQLASAYAMGVLPFVVREHSNAVAIWKSLRLAVSNQRLDRANQRFEETLRARIPKHLQRELEPLLRQTTDADLRQWCEGAYEFVLRAGACFCGELKTPLRAVEREDASAAAKARLLRYWLSVDAEAAIHFFWSRP